MADETQVQLRVAEANQDDIEKGIVRIDSAAMKQLRISQGAIVELSGERTTVAIAARAFPADMDKGIIRMDGLTRRNAGTTLGEQVTIKSVSVKTAKRIVLAPAQKGIMIRAHPDTFKRALLGRAVSQKDIISLGGTRRRRTTFSGSPFEDIFNMLGDDMMGMGFGMPGLRFVVISTAPKEAVLITEDTEIDVREEAVELPDESRVLDITYEDIGGLDQEIKKVREMIELPLKNPEIFDKLGISPPKGVLLYGPPGTGKTLLAKAVANESKATFITLNGPEIMSKFVGEAEKKLRKLFADAEKNSPAIIFIDEIDAIAPKREESYGEVERRVVAQLLASMDGMKGRGKTIVIAATNRQDSLDPALRRGGRFDREIEIGVPDTKGRLDILKIHTRNMPLTKDVKLKEFAKITHGFVGADLEGLCKEAAMSVLRRVLKDYDFKKEGKIPAEILEKMQVTTNDFKEGLKMVSPSAMREVLIEHPNVKWEKIGGLEKMKQELKETVEWPLKNPEVFKRMGINPPRGVLMYGPPGCGKTLLAKAVATESEANFISVKGPEVLSKWVGESEKAIRNIFQKARQVAPSIVFFDEIDAIASSRGRDDGARVGDKVVNQILTEMDGLEELNDVVVLAATNRAELVDPGLLRPGRLDRHLLILPPDEEAREAILEIHTKKMPLAKDVKIKNLAKKMDGYSGADIEAVCREAAMLALRADLKADEVTEDNFDKAMKEITGSLTKLQTAKYAEALASAKSGKAKSNEDYFG
jgi:transitional endoplasmic reticulum ATPase